VQAVIDKNLTAALLAAELRADALLLLTNGKAVFSDWPKPAREPIALATPRQLRERHFAPGSMGPKVEAACRFVGGGGRVAASGALADASAVLAGRAGTPITREPKG